uniref:Uncharacterized protein n=1 Tax=Arcella intermedia TaxID=1963864 RepID=A0A6B2LRE3_9EUKA
MDVIIDMGMSVIVVLGVGRMVSLAWTPVMIVMLAITRTPVVVIVLSAIAQTPVVIIVTSAIARTGVVIIVMSAVGRAVVVVVLSAVGRAVVVVMVVVMVVVGTPINLFEVIAAHSIASTIS